MERLNRLLKQVQPSVQTQSFTPNPTAGKQDDDVVIVSAVRTAIGRAKKGSFKDTHPGDLLSAVLQGAVAKAGIKPEQVGDIVVGNVLAPGGFAMQARMSEFLAGFPETVPVTTLNRQCSSGLQAVANVAANIRAGNYEIGIGAGVESMSKHEMGPSSLGDINERIFENELAQGCLNTMGQTSENVAAKYGISRAKQDQFAFESHQRAAKAQEQGLFKEEIIPVKTKIVDADGKEKEITVTADDGPRKDTTVAGLAKLKPAFKKDGTTTAGNSSQVSDGAAAVVLTTRRKANELKLPILGTFKAFHVSGVRPEIMGIGPAVAIPDVLKKAGMKTSDIDIYEINEAFASQATYCCDQLGLDSAKVNPKGGAIALGHPLGCTGARQISTLLTELRRTGKKNGVVSMCIGSGMGAAAILTAE
jgi:acetyl-CoA acyltransferase 1